MQNWYNLYKTAVSIKKLKKIPRYTHATIDIFGKEISVIDSTSFIYMYKEIIEKQIYKFISKSPDPEIIDGGANIGLSVIYFKQLYPCCNIIAFEPDPDAFSALQNNVNNFGLSKVQLINKGIWSSETTINLSCDGADGSSIFNTGAEKKQCLVSTTRLREYLKKRIDFLKLDIEGAETEVLSDCYDLLCNVENLFVEYHSFVGKPQTLHILINILHNAGFRLYMQSVDENRHPFCGRNVYQNIDMHLNIFSFRE